MEYKISNILCASDLSAGAPRVLKHALGLAAALGARVHIVHALEPLGEFAHSMIDSYLSAEVRERLEKEGYADVRNEIQRRLDELGAAADGGLLGHIKAIEGVPYEVIIDQSLALDADMIVMGSRGHSALGELFLGSVAHKVTVKSKLPVVLVPVH